VVVALFRLGQALADRRSYLLEQAPIVSVDNSFLVVSRACRLSRLGGWIGWDGQVIYWLLLLHLVTEDEF
jgi:hypothetical protein